MAFTDTTVSLTHIYDQSLFTPPAIIREDNPKREVESTTDNLALYLLIPEILNRKIGSSTGGDKTLARGDNRNWFLVTLPELEQKVPSQIDPWVASIVKSISAVRESLREIEQPDTTSEMLDTAELLATGFSKFPVHSRPQFTIDACGLPSFAVYNDTLYLHLTVDSGSTVSWYKVVNGDTESFQDEIHIDAANLDFSIREIMSA